MVTSYIDIDGKWGVLISYDFDMLDWDDISAVLKTFGLTKERYNVQYVYFLRQIADCPFQTMIYV